MANKNEVVEQGKQQAEITINNAFMDGIVSVMNNKVSNGLTLPSDYSMENAVMSAYLTLKSTVDRDKKPVLESCNKESISNSILEMVTSGLDVSKSQGYFIPYGGKLSFQKSYFGWKTMARRCGVINFADMPIYDGDEFGYEIVNGQYKNITHKQSFSNINKDKIIGAYCIATFADGSQIADVMGIDDIKLSWGMNKSNNGNGDTHKKFPAKMAMKTVTTRLCKCIVNIYGNAEIKEYVEVDEEFEDIDFVAADVKHDLETKANTEVFHEADFADAEVVDEKVEAEVVQGDDVPEFMK